MIQKFKEGFVFRRTAILGVCVALIASLGMLTGCSRGPAEEKAGFHAGGLDWWVRFGGEAPGSLLSAEPVANARVPWLGDDGYVVRVTYRSTEGDTGVSTVVSGMIFKPTGEAPDGGWPVVAVAHGANGINEACAPSLSDTLLGQAPLVRGMLDEGYAVVVPDYQGLGAPGIHPFMDARTAGYNIIDGVRALRVAYRDTAARWGAFGQSQGGAAVWSAAENAKTYAPDVEMVGAVAISPPADVTGAVTKAAEGTLTREQVGTAQWLIASLSRLDPDFPLDDYRRGVATDKWDVLSQCSSPSGGDRDKALKSLEDGDLAPSSPEAADLLRSLLRKWALPQQPLEAPLFVLYGGKDKYIDADWTTDALHRACELGGAPLQWELDPEAGHDVPDIKERLEWLRDRFAAKPVASDCPVAEPRHLG